MDLYVLLLFLPETDCATLFQHDKAQGYGDSLSVRDGERKTGAWDNIVSAVKVERGCAITVYKWRNFNGEKVTWWSTQDYVGDNFNDQIKSWECQCN